MVAPWSVSTGSIIQNLFLLTLVISIEWIFNKFVIKQQTVPMRSGHEIEGSFVVTASYEDLFKRSYEAYQFLYDSHVGMARISPVTERPHKVKEVNRCRIARQFSVLEVNFTESIDFDTKPISSIKWTKSSTDDFWIFSSFLDRRHNSLFPSSVLSIQVNLVSRHKTYR